MVKLVYQGKMAVGMQIAPNFALPVELGKTYDIPEWLAPQLIKNGEWKYPKEEKHEEKTKVVK